MDSEFGLLTRDEERAGEPIPLLGVKVKGDILGRGARVRVFQRFRNRESKAVEAVYKFPLPEGAAICGFKAHVDGRVIEGKVEEKERAFELYDDALSRGDGGYLLDEERPNIFTLSVGNLNPGTEVLIEIEYVTLLDVDGRRIRFFLPTTISPRYLPDGTQDDNGIPVDGRLHPPYAAEVPYGVSIDLMLHKGSLLESVESPSHQVRIEDLKGDPVHVSLSSESVRMDRDFILHMDYVQSAVSRAYQYRTGEEVFVQLDFLPNGVKLEKQSKPAADPKGLKRELVFLVDCSGSMQGDSIGEAKKALEVCLRGVEEGKWFNVYRFGSTHESLFGETKAYSEKTADEALLYVKTMDADLGGTEILKPLKQICSSKRKIQNSGMDIILLTDGQVGNESEILKLIRKNSAVVRVFPVGIGAGCNEYFIKGLARAGGGASEFIFPGERVEPKVLGIFGKLNEGVVTDLDISWGASTVEQAPAAPVVFAGSAATFFARIPGGSVGKRELKVKGKVDGRKQVWEIEVMDLEEQSLPIPTLWARERIRDLEESGDALLSGSRQSDRKMGQVNERIVEISKNYGLISQATSYVAVEQREEKEKTTGEVALRKVPVLLNIGWHGIRSLGSKAYPMRMLSMADASIEPLLAEPKLVRAPDLQHAASFERAPKRDLSRFIQKFDASPPPPKSKEPREERVDVLLHILSLQRPGGGMKLDENAARVLGINFYEVGNAAGQVMVRIFAHKEWRPVDPFILLSTAILILVLERYFSMERSTWEGVADKSKSWLNDIVRRGEPEVNGRDLMSWAERFVGNMSPRF